MTSNIVCIGNPGTGKSTLLNCLCRRAVFKSGVSVSGHGVTYELQKVTVDGVTYCDTPGLEDDKLRKEAAAAVESALRSAGTHKVFFVVTTESGRVRPSDKATVNLVLQAAPSIGHQYGVIVNKLPPPEYKKLVGSNFSGITTEFRNGLPMDSVHFQIIQRHDDLEGVENAFCDIPEVEEFMKRLPQIRIENVSKINIQSFEEQRKQFEDQLVKFQQDHELQRREIERLQRDLKGSQQHRPNLLGVIAGAVAGPVLGPVLGHVLRF